MYLKIRTMPTPTTTVNYQCWQQLDRLSIWPPLKFYLSKTDYPYYATICQCTTVGPLAALNLDADEARIFNTVLLLNYVVDEYVCRCGCRYISKPQNTINQNVPKSTGLGMTKERPVPIRKCKTTSPLPSSRALAMGMALLRTHGCAATYNNCQFLVLATA